MICSKWLPLALVAAAPLLSSPSAEGPSVVVPRKIVVGSKNFTENRLLAEVLAQHLRRRLDVVVEHRENLGATAIVAAALRQGEIDLYPEYTGTAWAVHLGIAERIAHPLHAYLHVVREDRRRHDLHWLLPFGFANSFALAVPRAVAEAQGLRAISDLHALATPLRIGLAHEFLERADGWRGLVRHYGLQLGEPRGMDHTLAYAALARGEVDLIDTWTTDGKLLEHDLVLLQDDRGYFPPYDCAPVVRGETLRRMPELRATIEELGLRIDAERMQRWNARVEASTGSLSEVARACLAELDLSRPWYAREHTGAGEAAAPTAEVGRWYGQPMRILRYTWDHLLLTGLAVLLAAGCAIPGGILLAPYPAWSKAILALTSVIQTIPGLALLAMLIPWLGLGLAPALAALFLYALLPILRNTTTGLAAIDPLLMDAARGMGLRRHERLFHIALPLAVPMIMAGLRTAAVTSVGVATLAAFIGAGGLGEPIVIGLQLDDQREILRGALPAAALAMLIDRAMGWVERRFARRRAGFRLG